MLLEVLRVNYVPKVLIAMEDMVALANLEARGIQVGMEQKQRLVNPVKLAMQLRVRSYLLLAPLMQTPFVHVM